MSLVQIEKDNSGRNDIAKIFDKSRLRIFCKEGVFL